MSDMESLSDAPTWGELVPSGAGPRGLAHRDEDRRTALLGRWLLAQRSPNTRTAYRNDLLDFFRWADEWRDNGLGGAGVFEFQRAHIDAYAEFLGSADHDGMRYRSKTKYSPATIARKLTAVSSFYAYLVDEAGHPANPVARVKRPKVSDKSLTPGLTEDEVRRVLQVADEDPLSSALVRLLLGTGLRVSEVCNADTGDISRDGGRWTIRVRRKGGEPDIVPMPDSAARAVHAYLRNRRGALFISPRTRKRATRDQVSYWLKRLTARAGVTKALTPHGLRHTMATLALDRGATLRDVQMQLGHKDPKTTIRYDRARTRLDNSALRAISEIMDGEQ